MAPCILCGMQQLRFMCITLVELAFFTFIGLLMCFQLTLCVYASSSHYAIIAVNFVVVSVLCSTTFCSDNDPSQTPNMWSSLAVRRALQDASDRCM